MATEYPIRDGKVTDWDTLEQIWQHATLQASKDQQDHIKDVYITLQPKQKDTDQALIRLFETLNARRAYIGTPASSSLYASGRTTGLVFEVGEGIASCIPVFEGHCLKNAMSDRAASGRIVSDHFLSILLEENQDINQQISPDVLRDMKEKLSRVG